MKQTWLNLSVYPLLERIGAFQNYFVKICAIIAAICFFMSLLMAVIKIFLGITDAREQVIKLATTTVIYFILMFIYPVVMKAILPFSMNLGYGAVFATQKEYSVKDNERFLGLSQGSASQFYEWLGQQSEVFSTRESISADGVKTVSLDMNMVDKKTGYYDINKFVEYIIAFLQIGFLMLPKVSLLKITPITLLSSFGFVLGLFVAVVCNFICLINYIMCLLDYFSLVGFGVLMIPLSLWDGTKSYTEKLYGSIGSIIIKLMVISAFMYLATMTLIDSFVELYVNSIVIPTGDVLVSNPFTYIQMTVTFVFQGFLLYTLTTNTEKIAGFLNGGSPSMSFGEAAMSMAAMTATMIGANSVNRKAMGVVGNASSYAKQGIKSGIDAAGYASANGESGAKAFMSSMGASVGGNVASSLLSAATNAPGNLVKAGSVFTRMTGLHRAVGSEGFTFGRFADIGGGSGDGNGGQGGNEKKDTTQFDNGVYGKAERNEKGEFKTKSDEMINKSNELSKSSDYFDRQKGARLASYANIMKNVRQTGMERAAGDVMGNGYGKAVMGGIGQGIKGYNTSELNAGSGMKMNFERNGEAAHRMGSDRVNVEKMDSQNSQMKSSYGGSKIDNSDVYDRK